MQLQGPPYTSTRVLTGLSFWVCTLVEGGLAHSTGIAGSTVTRVECVCGALTQNKSMYANATSTPLPIPDEMTWASRISDFNCAYMQDLRTPHHFSPTHFPSHLGQAHCISLLLSNFLPRLTRLPID